MNEPMVDRDPIEVLADEFVQRHRAGQGLSIAQFAEEHPEHADDIRELFPLLVNIERLKNEPDHPSGKPAALGLAQIERLGDFHILREIGRGGMGVVYEAEQKSLKRRVALKVLGTTAASSPHQLERFQREAEAAAHLHHTNIVPVYGIGQSDDLHFYAMQYIDGVGLDAVLGELRGAADLHEHVLETELAAHAATEGANLAAARRTANSLRDGSFSRTKKPGSSAVSSAADQASADAAASHKTPAVAAPEGLGSRYWKSVARMGADLADALDYAHHHGILHRDIKPSNLLIDCEGNAWITDFGLAKHQQRGALTETGDIVGTLRYMAPEQFNGQSDNRTDIYGLGLTLYEMITLRPAFPEFSHGRLIQQKASGDAPAPRSLNRSIPRDLETITLKACAADAALRYRTAGEMAADLRRFLEDRPILARRSTAAERLWRWARRNPALACASGAAAVLLIAVVVVSQVGYVNTKAALVKAQHAQNDAETAQRRAEDNLNLAIQAFDNIFDSVARRGVPQSLELEFEDEDAPRFETVLTEADAELVRNLLTFYEQFARQNSADVDVRAKTAAAHHRIGEIHQRLGHDDDAEKSYRQALTIYDDLLSHFPQRADFAAAKARTLNNLGVLYGADMPTLAEALGQHRQAIEFLSKQPVENIRTRTVRLELARAHDLAGSVGIRTGFTTFILETPEPKGPLQNDGPRPKFGRPPSDGNRRGPPPFGSGFGPDGTRTPREPGEPNAGRQLGPGGKGPRGPGAFDPAWSERQLALACDILERLTAEDATDRESRLALAQAERHRFVHYLLGRRMDAAAESFKTTREILERLVEADPQEPRYRVELADALSLAGARLSTLTEEQAEEYLQRAVDAAEPLAAAFPSVAEYQALLASSYRNLARLHRRLGKLEQAEGELAHAEERLASLVTRYPEHEFYPLSLALTSLELAETARARGEAEQDSSQLETSRAILERTVAGFPSDASHDNPFRRRILEKLYRSLAVTSRALGDDAAADEAARKAQEPGRGPFRGPGEKFDRRPGPRPFKED
jgi:serine/threonine protein kinase